MDRKKEVVWREETQRKGEREEGKGKMGETEVKKAEGRHCIASFPIPPTHLYEY